MSKSVGDIERVKICRFDHCKKIYKIGVVPDIPGIAPYFKC